MPTYAAMSRGCAFAIVILCLLDASSHAQDKRSQSRLSPSVLPDPSGVAPFLDNRVHRVGNLHLSITNWGFFGSGFRDLLDPCTGRPAPSLEFPAGSSVEYLFAGALWVGGVRNGDTLVSVGRIGDASASEMFPERYPDGAIVELTNRPVLKSQPGSECPDVTFSSEAISEQDLIAVYCDTLTDPRFVITDEFDGRKHTPLGVRVTQRSHAWSFSAAQGFIIVDFDISNIGVDPVEDVYIGLHMDQDVLHLSEGFNQQLGWMDDVTGALRWVPSRSGVRFPTSYTVAWIADNDGDPSGGVYVPESPTGVVGVRILRPPDPTSPLGYNWWVTDEPSRDWGPNLQTSRVDYILGNLGTPYGDKAKYQIMSNGEFDYDQVESALNHEVDGWRPPVRDPLLAQDLADGADARYLLSYGPYDLLPDSSLLLSISVLAAQGFHTDPTNFRSRFDPFAPQAFLEHLNYENLGTLAQWAEWVYDAPGIDTDDDGYRGEFLVINRDTIYYAADGAPDYLLPPPPPFPRLAYSTSRNRVVLRWNGRESETTIDPFSLKPDFEGYRVYMSRTGHAEDYALLTQRDNINYARRRWHAAPERWMIEDDPFTLDSLKALYDMLTDSLFGYAFHPDSFSVPTLDKALLHIILDDRDPSRLDSNYYCFQPFNANAAADDLALANAAAHGLVVDGVIRKLYPTTSPEETHYRDDGTSYAPYYEYEYAIDGLQVAEPVYLTVTAFDFGNAAVGLAPNESSPAGNSEEIWPIESVVHVKEQHLRPGVYPNPYRAAEMYYDQGWENRRGLEPDRERARQVTFYNVPDTCVVSVWTLDGDLVRSLEHRADPASSEASVVVWNLITRNTQAVKTGIYIWSVESRFGTDVGKLVIIK
jgi:hypothetical protein